MGRGKRFLVPWSFLATHKIRSRGPFLIVVMGDLESHLVGADPCDFYGESNYTPVSLCAGM